MAQNEDFEIQHNAQMNAWVNGMELTVSDSGYARLSPDWNSENVVSPFSRLYLMIEGEAVLTTDEQRVVMESGHLYLIPPGLRFNYSCRDRFTKLYFHVNILRPDGYDLMQGFGRIGVASVEPARIANLAARYGSNRLADLVQVKTELYRLMDRILTEYDFASDAMRTYSPRIQDTISYIQANLSARLSVEQLARRLFVSRSFLTERFRRETGVTIGRYLDDQLMAAAQWQLLRTGRSIGEISESLGYCDQFYFARRFKQLCGESPLQYRKKIRAGNHVL